MGGWSPQASLAAMKDLGRDLRVACDLGLLAKVPTAARSRV